MEKRERFVIEVLLGATLIVFLILLAFLVTSVSAVKNPYSSQGTTNTITNSYNTNTYPTRTSSRISYPQDSSRGIPVRYSSYRNYGSPYRPSYSYSKPYVVDGTPYARGFLQDDLRYTRSDNRYLRYEDRGRRRMVRGVFGNDIDRYEVYVRNRGYTGGYFKVNFYFKDYYGRTRTESTNRYISPRGESRFVFKDISRERYKYPDWSYRVTSQTRVPTKVYYN